MADPGQERTVVDPASVGHCGEHWSEKHCLIPGCTRSAIRGSRGLCPTHRSTLGRHVKRGTITWKELEILGLSVPATRHGRGPGRGTIFELIAERRKQLASTEAVQDATTKPQ